MEYCDIYKIYCKNADITDCYIGSSFSAKERFYHHKTDCSLEHRKAHNMPAYQFIRENGGIDNWTYEVLERVEKPQQRIREQHWIQELKPTLNNRRAYTDKETAKEIRNKSEAPKKEEIARKKREYRQRPEVRERELQRMKEWRENNKEHHNQLTQEWREKNKAHIAQYAKEAYHKNKDAINARRREMYALKKASE